MKISATHLQAFVAVAQTKNFSKGADRIHITQSAISQRILNLEEDLEVTLFVRDPKNLRLTEEGLKLLRYCQVSLVLEAEFLNAIKSTEKTSQFVGTIRIGGFSSITRSVLLPTLADLIKLHPHLKLQLMTREVSELPGLLRQGEIDFMILNCHEEKTGLEKIHLGEEQNVLVQSKEAISNDTYDTYLDHDAEDSTTEQYLRLLGGAPDMIHRSYFDEIYSILDAVRLGYGKAVLPKHLISHDAQFQILHPRIILKTPVILYYYKKSHYSQLHLTVVRVLKERCQFFLK